MDKPIQHAMIIDDNDVDQRQVERVLKRSGLVEEIVTFYYADEALEHLKAHPREKKDVIFLDINMPRMSGFEFLDAAKAQLCEVFSDVIVMLTTSHFPGDLERAEKYKCVKAFLNKPFTSEDIATVVDLVKGIEKAA